MNELKIFQEVKFKPNANPKSMIIRGKARFTLLTSRLIRIEYDESSKFVDNASQAFLFREQLVPKFEIIEKGNVLEIITDYLELYYLNDGNKLNSSNLFIKIIETGNTWHFGQKNYTNLKGTTRTLDNTNGKIPLENGLMSKEGWSVVDDSKSLVFDELGWIRKREKEELDLYFFGYGRDFKQCLKDYCKIAGSIALIPRWALGNWWSRYWEYSQEELTDLMNEFEKMEIPLSVCIIDMDWHVVKIKEYLEKHSKGDFTGVKFHDGWTGFTWNEDLFPDHEAFIKFLHEKGLKTALNMHPASGIYPHEVQYEQFARFMGIDPKSHQPIEFDLSDPRFVEAYFQIIYHPYEQEGIDFWWTDWQQGESSKIEGLDPLWWINHLSFYDSGRNKDKRPFIFSRWGGLGNHRYPIGFSGDTFATWNSLSFLPYFTTTASNVGFSWWSHDLGGHMNGRGVDPELYVRWIQFGLFSPIFRLHSTKNLYNERLPWMFNEEVFAIAKHVMQLRHSFIPYIYTMAWKTCTESHPLITPMYYEYPNQEEAYEFPNQYFFGTELLCSPFISKIDEDLGQCRQEVWLPEGTWFDFFTGEYYEGNQVIAVYGLLNEIPVFAKAGAIIPLSNYTYGNIKWNNTDNPRVLDMIIFPGKDNAFSLYEDDGISQDFKEGKHVLTEFELKNTKKTLQFSIKKVNKENPSEFILGKRAYNLIFKSINQPEIIDVKVNGKETSITPEYEEDQHFLQINGIEITPFDEIEIFLSMKSGNIIYNRGITLMKCRKLLRYMNLDSIVKMHLDNKLEIIIKSSKKMLKFFNMIMSSVQLASNSVSANDLDFLKKVIPMIMIGNLIEEILNQPKENLIKNKLYSLNLTDLNEAKTNIWEIIQRSLAIKNLFLLKENQIQALIEMSQNGRINK